MSCTSHQWLPTYLTHCFPCNCRYIYICTYINAHIFFLKKIMIFFSWFYCNAAAYELTENDAYNCKVFREQSRWKFSKFKSNIYTTRYNRNNRLTPCRPILLFAAHNVDRARTTAIIRRLFLCGHVAIRDYVKKNKNSSYTIISILSPVLYKFAFDIALSSWCEENTGKFFFFSKTSHYNIILNLKL